MVKDTSRRNASVPSVVTARTAKVIRAGREVRVVDDPLQTRNAPLAAGALQSIFIPEPFTRLESHAEEVDLHVVLPRLELEMRHRRLPEGRKRMNDAGDS